MQPRTFVLHSDTQAAALASYLRLNREAMEQAGTPLEVTVSQHKTKRHNQQNRLYWSVLRQIAEQAMVGGRQYSDECWHEWFKGHFLGFVDLPGGRKVGESTTKLSVSEFADYVNKVQAYAISELGVILEG